MSERIVDDLAKRLDLKIHRNMNDFIDLCIRADCDREVVSNYMISIMVREALTGMISIGMHRKNILAAIERAHDLMRPALEKQLEAMRDE
jgi:hypothetical protein